MAGVRVYTYKHGLLYPLDGGTPIAPAGATVAPPAPPTPGGTGLLVGASVSRGQTAYDAIQATAGPWSVTRSYNSGMFAATPQLDACGPDIGKRASVFSAKPNLADMASGALDAPVRAWLQAWPDSHIGWVTIWHEADVKMRKASQTGSGPMTPELFIPAFTRFCELVREVGKPHMYTHLCVSNWTFLGGTAVTMDTLWPGSGLVDVISVDQYMESNTQHTGAYYFAPVVAYAAAKGVGWAIAEIGMGSAVTDFSAGATWMGTQATYAATHGAGHHANSAAFLTWFDINVGGVTPTPSGNSALVTASAAISTAHYLPYTTFVL
jgi:hypothetical protein